MTQPLRKTGVTPYRRLVTTTIIEALRSVFDESYNREPQFRNLKVTQKYPLVKVDYPALVVEYEDKLIANAGVGHEEWFDDPDGIIRKWHHRRFEGTLTFTIYALSTIDRDLFADALVEVLSFGRLDAQLTQFFTRVYGDKTQPFSWATLFNQLMLNIDEIDGGGNNASVAPWQPEDVLVYTTSYSIDVHGGFYNTLLSDTWPYLTAVNVDPYPQGDVSINQTFEPHPPVDPYPNLEWLSPFEYYDEATAEGVAHSSAAESQN